MENFFTHPKTLLADEEYAKIMQPNTKTYQNQGVKTVRLCVTDNSYGNKKGNYSTVSQLGKRSPVSAISQEIKFLIGKESYSSSKVLLVGIGNPYMTTDSLGAKVVENIISVRPTNLYLLTPMLEGITGIPSFDVIRAIVKSVKPKLVIVVDALATFSADRICKSYQTSDAGITPGSALGKSLPLNKKTLGVKVIAIGTPTVIYSKQGDEYQNMLVTPKNIDELISNASINIAKAILKALE